MEFACFLGVGAGLAHARLWRVYWTLLAVLAAVFAVSAAVIWRPEKDDPFPALLFLEFGVYGSVAGAAGLILGGLGRQAMR